MTRVGRTGETGAVQTLEEMAAVMMALPREFGSTLALHMQRLNFTDEQLAESALITPKTVWRLRNDADYHYTRRTVTAVCVGLRLEPPFWEDMLTKAGFSLRFTVQDCRLRVLMDPRLWTDIYDFNRIMAELGGEPVGSEREGV